MTDWLSIRLTREPLDAAEAITAVSAASTGGIDLFLGVTRAEESAELGPLLHLDYHAYEEMAAAELRRIADRAKAQWQVVRMVVWHRLGPVAVGEPSVVIAVSSPHRNDAFMACRYMIDELKKLAPIWKREVYRGDARWQSPPHDSPP